MLKNSIAKQAKQWKTKKFFLLGPAFITAIGYIDPGNFATNIQSGAIYGYQLLWVVIIANLMAMLIQLMSAKLGIATGKNLAEHIRDSFPRSIVWFYWIQTEIIAIATDLAESIGAAIGFKILFGIPLIYGLIITSIITFVILTLQNNKQKILELIIAILLIFVAIIYIVELFFSKPKILNFLQGIFIPSLPNTDAVILSAGILGATIMPHVIYLHSSLTQKLSKNKNDLNHLYSVTKLDIYTAMSIAGFVNIAIMAMSASAFHFNNHSDISDLEKAYLTLEPLLSKAAATIFGLSLLISGLTSTVVGTLAGQVIMQGFVKFYIPLWLRRLITILPSLILLQFGFQPLNILVISQVLISFGITFALFPLLKFSSNQTLMSNLVNTNFTKNIGKIIFVIIGSLNIYLIINIASNAF